MRRTKKVLAAALVCTTIGMSAVSATTFGADNSSPFSDEYNRIQAGLQTGTSVSTGTVQAGPGATKAAAENSVVTGTTTQTNGPVVKDVNLSEKAYQDFGMYEESMENLYFIYSNTGNGTITEKPVYVDIPANLSYTVELDGVPFQYVSKSMVSTHGTYVFRFYGIYDTTLPLAQQTEYHSTFRFRIQDKPVVPTTAAETSANGTTYTYNGTVFNGQEGIDPLNQSQAFNPTTPISFYDDPTQESSIAESEASTEGVEEETTAAEETEAETTAAEETEPVKKEILEGEETGLTEKFNNVTLVYDQKLLDGTVFSTSIPNGGWTNGTVSLRLPSSNTISMVVLKDGKPYDYTLGSDFTESGNYILQVFDSKVDFNSSYAGKRSPVFFFRILADAVNDAEIFNVPAGGKITSLELDGKPLSTNGDYILLPDDGTYKLRYNAETGGSIDLTIVKDTQKPGVSVTLGRGRADLTYSSEVGVGQVTFIRNGKEYRPQSTSKITEAGTYEVHVVDNAGNETVKSFSIAFHLATATIIVIMLGFGLIAAGIIFVVRVKKDLSLR